jgi:hypothetical protein
MTSAGWTSDPPRLHIVRPRMKGIHLLNNNVCDVEDKRRHVCFIKTMKIISMSRIE